MKSLKLTARIIIGIVFIFSGTVKAVDPLGTAYKFSDYFQAFGIGGLSFVSVPLAILLCYAEFIAGFSVLTGIRQKAGTWLVVILMSIFTPLTLILALTNPVSDCGCFGDAIHLTNWQTFYKNIVLSLFTAALFINRKSAVLRMKASKEWLVTASASFLFILFSLYNLVFLPVIDFLPYRKGADIAAQMTIPEDAKADVYNTTFIYEKDGVRKEFSLGDYPANDTSWRFIDQKSVLVEKGYQPPIHDFSITSTGGEDLTGRILSDKGYSLLMISKKLADAGKMSILEGFDTGRHCVNNGIGFYILTASSSEEIKKYENGLWFCLTDETTLKTMVRSNPGYILLKNGVITGKWSWADLPSGEWFERLADSEN